MPASNEDAFAVDVTAASCCWCLFSLDSGFVIMQFNS